MSTSVTVSSPYGPLILYANHFGLTHLYRINGLPDQNVFTQGISMPPPKEADKDSWRTLSLAADQLNKYFLGQRTTFDLPLSPSGTTFQLKVWTALSNIPFGECASYGQIAKAIGQAKAARAVGGANNRNPLPIIIPCHRVIAADGNLGGYAWGHEIKRALLAHEAAQLRRN